MLASSAKRIRSGWPSSKMSSRTIGRKKVKPSSGVGVDIPMGKSENVCVFEDTEKTCKDIPYLSLAIKPVSARCREYILGETPDPSYRVCSRYSSSRFIESRKRTLEAAKAYTGKKVCVLNFASATNPGGGVTRGSSAQEEAICRCSTLYPCLNNAKMWNAFYVPHRHERNPLHNDDCIYTPTLSFSRRMMMFLSICRKASGIASMCLPAQRRI